MKKKKFAMNERRMRHCLGVARFMYLNAGFVHHHPTEAQRRDLWLLGYLHDMGREFEFIDKRGHAKIGSDIAKFAGFKFADNILNHGEVYGPDPALKLLDIADMHIDSEGNYVSIRRRLKNIEKNHGGKDSKAYICARKLAESIWSDKDWKRYCEKHK